MGKIRRKSAALVKVDLQPEGQKGRPYYVTSLTAAQDDGSAYRRDHDERVDSRPADGNRVSVSKIDRE